MFNPNMINTRIVSLLFAAALFTACPAAEGVPGTQGNPGNSGGNVEAGAGKNTISGQALDVRGKPIAGALIWVYPAVTGGLVTAHTDAQGRYLVKSLPDRPYKVYAWAQPEVSGKRHCLRLGHDAIGDYDPVYPRDGAVRNFRWKLEGVIPDRGNDTFFGGQIRLMPVFRKDSDWMNSKDLKVEVTLVPNGALADGSTGKTITRVLDWDNNHFVENIPVGTYTVTASQTTPSGVPSTLEVGPKDSSLGAQSGLGFAPDSCSCGGDFGNGTTRTFLYVGQP